MGVEIEKITCYDISSELISLAKQKNTSEKVEFKKLNLAKDFTMVEEFDLVIFIYGWHWMTDLQKATNDVFRAIKKGGMVISATYLESKMYFERRKAMMESEKWKGRFTSSSL